MRASPTSPAGSSGQSYVTALLEALGWGVAPNPVEHDLGTDLWVSPRDPRRFDLAVMLGIQVKNGDSWFDEPGTVEDRSGWWFRDSREHFDYWLNHAVPHIVVLRMPTTGLAYWVHVNKQTFQDTGKSGKVFVPDDQVLGADALPTLVDIATSVRPRPRWSGSAWSGAPDLAPSDLLRHALLAPRLVAPHPNAGVRALSAHEAIALLTAGRFGELDRYRLLSEDTERTGWGWDFFSALLEFLQSGNHDLLRECVQGTKVPHERAASAAAFAAVLVESGAHDEALQALEGPLGADDGSPIDHAWLQVHRARSLAETGHSSDAVDLAVNAQALPARYPEDVTAAAIATGGASLVFRAADVVTGNVAAYISSSDTEASWWRAQAISWGLSTLFDESFRRWGGPRRELRISNDNGAYRLRGVSLVAGFTPLHGAWCDAISTLAKSDLMSGALTIADAATDLTDLRLSGRVKAIERGVANLLKYGPAEAVRAAGDQIDLNRCTRTDARSSIELVVRGADVLDVTTAAAAARWAMQGKAELEVWARRVQLGSIVEDQLAAVLKALAPVVSTQVLDEIRKHLITLQPLDNQGAAHAWASVVAAVPETSWTANEVEALLGRSGDHREFADAVRHLAVLHDADARAQNDERLRAGDLEALVPARVITAVPHEAVAPLQANAGSIIRERLAKVRGGTRSAYVGVDPAGVLVQLNVFFPDDADWAPVLELLSEPLADHGTLERALWVIQQLGAQVDDRHRGDLADALAGVVARAAPTEKHPLFDGDPRAAAASALDSLRPGAITSAQWASARDAQSRSQLVIALGRRADPGDAGTLVALAGDPDPHVRAAVAASLSYWVVKDVETGTALDVLQQLLADEGTLVARHVVSSWPDEPVERVRPLHAMLATHLSAKVRSAARHALEILGTASPDATEVPIA